MDRSVGANFGSANREVDVPGAQSATDDEVRCSFCGKKQRQVKRLVAGRGVYICNECVDLCNDVIAEGTPEPPVAAELDEVCKRLYQVGSEVAELAKRLRLIARRSEDVGSKAPLGDTPGPPAP